jgi:hypothetical protein
MADEEHLALLIFFGAPAPVGRPASPVEDVVENSGPPVGKYVTRLRARRPCVSTGNDAGARFPQWGQGMK